MAILSKNLRQEMVEKIIKRGKRTQGKYFNDLFKNNDRIRIPYKEHYPNIGIRNTIKPTIDYGIKEFLEQNDWFIDQNNMAYNKKNPNNKTKIGRVINDLYKKGVINQAYFYNFNRTMQIF